MDLGGFSKLMAKRAKELPQAINDLKKDAANTTLDTLVETTPIDTSLAVSNYQVGIGSSVTGSIPAHFPGVKRSTAEQSKSATKEIGQSIISGVQPGQSLHITNNVRYIGELEDGSSSQAPAGMKKLALQSARFVLENAKLIKG